MANHNDGKRRCKTEYMRHSRRLLALLLCLCTVLSSLGGAITITAFASVVEIAKKSQDTPQEETKEETKARLLWQIREKSWDPYSADMTLDEFYALMELFQEGTLPLEGAGTAEDMVTADSPIYAASGFDAPGIEESGTGEPSAAEVEEEIYIPREMFLFSGLNAAGTTDANGNDISSKPGKDSTNTEYGPPLNYDTVNGAGDDLENYPAGLDPYKMGYTRPPENWKGVKVEKQESGALQALVVFAGQNDNDNSIVGNVIQDLFLHYEEHYIRRVTAQNMEATILGAIKLSGRSEYVYYYLTSDNQSSDVSTTTLPAGHKFIIEYLPVEHTVTYKVLMNSTDGMGGTDITNMTPENTPNVGKTVNVLGKDMPNTTWENIIFGAKHPAQTDGGAYSFAAYAPYGYTVEFYLLKPEVSDKPTLEMGTKGIVIDGNIFGGPYTAVNNGWALGMEPDYINGNAEGAAVTPNTNKGPGTLTMSGTFYNNDVHHDRTVIAVVTKNPAPTFLVAPINKNTDNVSNRGTSAITTIGQAKNNATGEIEYNIPYDYEDVYLWTNGRDSKYDYSNYGTGGNWAGSNASHGNLKDGNVATVDNWVWQGRPPYNAPQTMKQEADGTYSYQWTWQTNNSDNYVLDTLAINGTSITIPFLAKQAASNDPAFDAWSPGTDGGIKTWYTETDIAGGIHVKVECLMIFKGNNHPQRVYRITATGARSNVVITSMNLMQYASGAAEFAVYQIDGITGAILRDDGGKSAHTAAIQYYGIIDNAIRAWDENFLQGRIVVTDDNYSVSDLTKHGANIRFRLADGYDSPCFLWESTKEGVINGQASISRNADGSLNYSDMNKVLLLSELGDGELMDSQHIYKDDDGWYYIRVTTQDKDKYKIALLTIVARQVRYVVRYIPSYAAVRNETNGNLLRRNSLVGIVDNPFNMPIFDHTNDGSHDSFFDENNGIPGEQYDNKDGAYYDTTVDDIAILPTDVPIDNDRSRPDGTIYRFVDWVLVDDKFNPVWAWTNPGGDLVQVTTDQYGNRILVTPNNSDDTIHHPALLEDGKLVVGSNYTIQWNSTTQKYELYQGDSPVTVNNWVTLTRDGKLAYAATGEPATMPEKTDWTELLANWGVLDANGNTASISGSSEFHYRANHITLVDVNQYALSNEGLGGDETDICVLRLMPMWEPVANPFNYNVALNWVDAQGTVHEEFFADYWSAVITDWKITNGGLTVQVIKDAAPFKDWIAMHPTYTFWDDVNNNNALFNYFEQNPNADMKNEEDMNAARKAMREQMAAAVEKYLSEMSEAVREDVVDYLSRRDISGKDSNGNRVDNNGNGVDDFWRLGGYAFQVFEDEGTIVVWMYEDKGGLAFRKEVADESFTADDEFYFTVSQALVGSQNQRNLDGVYKAYPENVYDDNGVKRDFVDTDAWLVTFTAGKITSIVKNDGSHEPASPVTWFTLKSGEGIRLFVPAGNYTITELGSKSGGSYRVSVQYDGSSTPSLSSGWSLPEGNLWLKGQDTEYRDPTNFPAGVSQVSATVYFEIGESNMVHTLQFNNMTATLSIEKVLDATDKFKQAFADWLADSKNDGRLFHFAVELDLPAGYTPLRGASDNGNVYHYFNINIYNANGSFVRGKELVLVNKAGTDRWEGVIDLQAGQRAAIVMTAPDDEKPLYYEYIENDGENDIVITGEITDPSNIVDVGGIPYYQNAAGQNCRIYYNVGNKQVYIGSLDQIKYVTRTIGEPYLVSNNGDSLYYYIGRGDDDILDFDQITGAPSEVTLRCGPVDDGLGGKYGVYGVIDVPLYYNKNGEFKRITVWSDLEANIDSIYFRYGEEYYHTALNRVEDSKSNSGYTYEGVYDGLYEGSIATMLKKKFTVYSSRNGSDFGQVDNLNDVVVRVDSVTIPVSKELFNYEFNEVWIEDEWDEKDWNSVGNRTNLFNVVWTGQTGIAETGVTTKAKAVNWFGVVPDLVELPDSGGAGTLGLRLLGGALISAAFVLAWHLRKRRLRSV